MDGGWVRPVYPWRNVVVVLLTCPVCGELVKRHWQPWCKSGVWLSCAVCGTTSMVVKPP